MEKEVVREAIGAAGTVNGTKPAWTGTGSSLEP
jgi:hypothetical protein